MREPGSRAGDIGRQSLAALFAALLLVAGAIQFLGVEHAGAGTVPESCKLLNAFAMQDGPMSVEAAEEPGDGRLFMSQSTGHTSSCPGNGCPLNRTAVVETELDLTPEGLSFAKTDQDLPAGITHAAQPKPPRFFC